jgi:hypothetical protein
MQNATESYRTRKAGGLPTVSSLKGCHLISVYQDFKNYRLRQRHWRQAVFDS